MADSVHNCLPNSGIRRRAVLQAAGAGLVGGLAARPVPAAEAASSRACIFIWLNGGPSQFETFDPKPKATSDVRGPFGAIPTAVPGVLMSELVPQIARQFDRFAVVRSVAHGNSNHDSTALLTGIENSRTSFGAVVSKLLGPSGLMPPYIHIGSSTGDGAQFASNIDQVGGGELGSVYGPLRVRAPYGAQLRLGDFSLDEQVSRERFDRRLNLLHGLPTDAGSDAQVAVRKMRDERQRAVEVLSSSHVRDAFDVTREEEALRYRYGANFFGQSCLLARRLVEAGTRFIQIKWYDVVAFDAWDTHGADLPGMRRLEQQLCPRLDQGLSALLADLHDRGLLETTLVVVCGEFGRTPALNKNGDRDHWPYCSSVLMAGAGIPGGTIVGASDAKGAYPAQTPVSPADFAATIYKLVGLDPTTDIRLRPFVQNGLPIRDLVAHV